MTVLSRRASRRRRRLAASFFLLVLAHCTDDGVAPGREELAIEVTVFAQVPFDVWTEGATTLSVEGSAVTLSGLGLTNCTMRMTGNVVRSDRLIRAAVASVPAPCADIRLVRYRAVIRPLDPGGYLIEFWQDVWVDGRVVGPALVFEGPFVIE